MGGAEWRRQTRRPPLSFLPAALGRWTSERATLAPDPQKWRQRRLKRQQRAASLRLSGEEPNHRKEVLSPQPVSISATATPRPASPYSPQQPYQTGANQEIRLWPGSRLKGATRLVTPRQLAATLRFLRRIGISDQSTKRAGPDRLATGEPLFLGGRLSHLAPVHWLLSLPY